jgi:hypothetical protein
MHGRTTIKTILSVIFKFVFTNEMKALNSQNKEISGYLFATAHKEFIS